MNLAWPNLLLTLSLLLLGGGLWMILTRRNAVAVLIGVELVINAAVLNFVAFNVRHPERLDGQMAALLLIVLSAAEAAVALALVLRLYQAIATVQLDRADSLKG